VEVVGADEVACIVVAKSQVDIQDGYMSCLTRCDLSDYDYVSVGRDGFVPISVIPMMGMTRLSSNIV
jgi:hypothetical protein